jgi:WD40 repeat protein
VDFGEPKEFARAELGIVGLADDPANIKAPTSYSVEYWADLQWKSVQSPVFEPEQPTSSRFNRVMFQSVSSSKIRFVFRRLSATARCGVTEVLVWKEPGIVWRECEVATDLTALQSLKNFELRYLRTDGLIQSLRFDGTDPVAFSSTLLGRPILLSKPNTTAAFVLSNSRLLQVEPDANDVPRELRLFPGTAFTAALHPNQPRVAWCQGVANNEPELVLSNLDGTDETSLGFGYDPIWTADGASLVYTCHNDELGWHIAIYDGTQTRRLKVPAHPSVSLNPSPSPDGKQIAFSMHGDDGTMQIGIISSDGSSIRQVSRNHDLKTLSSWSPDGEYIAFVRHAPPHHLDGKVGCIVVVNVSTGEEFVLANNATAGSRAVWRNLGTP